MMSDATMSEDCAGFSPPLSPVKVGGASSSGLQTPFLIGVAGGTASGKSTVCQTIMSELGQEGLELKQRQVVMISQDSFYRNLTHEERERANTGEYNFDHPDAFDTELMKTTLRAMLDRKTVRVPVYDFRSHSRLKEMRKVYPADVVLFEGILVLYDPDVRDMLHMKLFVDTDSDTRLARRVVRDTGERGRALEQVLHQYTHFVKPAFEDFTLPTKKYADVIVPRGAENEVAINLIVQHIKDILAGNVSVYRRMPVHRKRTRRESDSYLVRPH